MVQGVSLMFSSTMSPPTVPAAPFWSAKRALRSALRQAASPPEGDGDGDGCGATVGEAVAVDTTGGLAWPLGAGRGRPRSARLTPSAPPTSTTTSDATRTVPKPRPILEPAP